MRRIEKRERQSYYLCDNPPVDFDVGLVLAPYWCQIWDGSIIYSWGGLKFVVVKLFVFVAWILIQWFAGPLNILPLRMEGCKPALFNICNLAVVILYSYTHSHGWSKHIKGHIWSIVVLLPLPQKPPSSTKCVCVLNALISSYPAVPLNVCRRLGEAQKCENIYNTIVPTLSPCLSACICPNIPCESQMIDTCW